MKKSKSSVPLFADNCEPGPAPPVRYDGLFATAGLPEPELAAPPAVPLVAIAVGKTNEGASLPAKPKKIVNVGVGEFEETSIAYQVSRILCHCKEHEVSWRSSPFRPLLDILVHDNSRSLGSHAGSRGRCRP